MRKNKDYVEVLIQKKEHELLSLQMHNHQDLPALEAPLKNELRALLEQEDLKWKQRAKEIG